MEKEGKERSEETVQDITIRARRQKTTLDGSASGLMLSDCSPSMLLAVFTAVHLHIL